MKADIYYFTGTGNSLSIARDLCQSLPECRLFSIPKQNIKNGPTLERQKIGFIFPLYYGGLPKIVFDFVDKLNVSNSSYFFTVITYAGDITNYPFIQLNQILEKKMKKLNAAYFILMPNNYILAYDTHSEQVQNKFFKEAARQVKNISEDVQKELNNFTPEMSKNKRNKFEKFNEDFRKKVNTSDKKFYINEDCNECGTCERVCPVNNIRLVEGKPEWQHRCQQCLACINFCPVKAIQYGHKTSEFGRYHHPKVTIKDLLEQKIE